MSRLFDIIETPISDLKVIKRHPIKDVRGYLERLFCMDELSEILNNQSIIQINHSFTIKAGTIRGLHFQFPPDSEIKLISCIRGEVFDVAVDLRKGSNSFLKYHSQILNSTNFNSFLIPQGFAHGFQTLTNDCELLYFHTAPYKPGSEGAINVFDPKLNIQWMIPVTDLSERDRNHAMLEKQFEGLSL